MKFGFFFSIIFLFSLAERSYAENCLSFSRSPMVQKTVSHLREVSKIKPGLWFNYQPDQQNYVLLSHKINPGCAVFLSADALEAWPLQQPVNPANGLYSFYFGKETKEIGKELHERLKIKSAQRAVVMILDVDPKSYFTKEKQYLFDVVGLDDFIEDTVTHEGFHLHGQIGNTWPEWILGQERDEIDPKCYRKTQEIEDLYKEESFALISAWQLLDIAKNGSLALQASKHFIELRKHRYTKLEELSQNDANPINCAKAEAEMEMLEGSAQWLGTGASIILGKKRPDQIMQSLHNQVAGDGAFYDLGMLQLYLMWKMSPTNFTKITERLSTSDSWERNLHAQFTETVRNAR